MEKIAIIGLGYVGLPLSVALAKNYEVIGFDVSLQKIKELQSGVDVTNHFSLDELNSCKVQFTGDSEKLREADLFIVCVPTPIDEYKKPNLFFIESSASIVGKYMKKGAIVVYESTVYPGVTEEIVVPILEKESGLKFNEDFSVGYSPERVNPGDKEHTVDKITKIVSASNKEALEILNEVYSSFTNVYLAPSIKVAEAAKVIENIQRDLNIGLINELALLFDKLNIDINQVLEAAGTKWNFHKYKPGLVGGHCIGV